MVSFSSYFHFYLQSCIASIHQATDWHRTQLKNCLGFWKPLGQRWHCMPSPCSEMWGEQMQHGSALSGAQHSEANGSKHPWNNLKFLSAKYLSHKGGFFFQHHLLAWILMICLHHLFIDWDGSQSFLIASYRHLDTRHRWFMFPKQTGKLWEEWDPSVWTRSRRAVSSDYKVF